MELSSIELQDSVSTATLTKVDPCSQEDITQFNERSDNVSVPHSDTVETTSTGVTVTIRNPTITRDNATITNTSESMIKSNKFSIKKYSSHICLVFVILIVIAIVLIPIILYYTISPQEASFLNVVNFKNCSVSTNVQERVKSDNTLIQICEAEGIQILDNGCSNTSAIRALQLVYALGALLENNHCVADALPFFCTAISSLCVDNTSLPSLNEECIQVRDNKCSSEWRIVENLFRISIPSCMSFKNGTNIIFASAPIQTCPDMFEVFCGSLCVPACHELPLFRDGVDIVYRVWFTILYAVNLIGAIITVIASIVYRQKMLQYPLIFIVYVTVTVQTYEFFFLLPIILGSNHILCADANLFVAINDPAVFCQIQGFVIQASIIMFAGFWIAHLLHMFYSVAFPFGAHRFMTSHFATRRVHFIEVFVIITVGLLCSTIIISTSGYEFVGFPQLCISASLAGYFYAQLLPFTIASAIGILILCSTLILIVRNRRRLNSSRKTLFIKFSAAEAKLFTVFLFYGVVILSILCNFCVFLRVIEGIVSTFGDYIICTAGGDKVECHAIEDRLYDATDSLLITDWIASTLGQFVSIVNLNFILQYSDIKKAIGYLLRLLANLVLCT